MTTSSNPPTEGDWGRRLREAEAPVGPDLSRAWQERLGHSRRQARVVVLWQQPAVRAAAMILLLLAPVSGIMWWQARTGQPTGPALTESPNLATTRPTPSAPNTPAAPTTSAIESPATEEITPVAAPTEELAQHIVTTRPVQPHHQSSKKRRAIAHSVQQSVALTPATPPTRLELTESHPDQAAGQPSISLANEIARQTPMPAIAPPLTADMPPAGTVIERAPTQTSDLGIEPTAIASVTPAQAETDLPDALTPPPTRKRGVVSQLVIGASRLARTPRSEIATQLAHQRDQVLAITHRRPSVELTQDRLSVSF